MGFSRKGLIISGIVILLFALVPLVAGTEHTLNLFILLFITIILAQSWNVLGGYAGQISLGNAAFFGVGALSFHFLAWRGGFPFYIALFAGGGAAVLLASFIGSPALRFRGAYFAMGTLALAEALRITIGNLFPLTVYIPTAHIVSYKLLSRYYLALMVALITQGLAYFMIRSKIGLAIMSIRDNDEAADASGVNLFKYKFIALAFSSFFSGLAGIDDPEEKRRRIGHEFIAVFEEEAKRFPDARFLAQGTLYPDVIESTSVRGPSATIKTHHNVGGLPERLGLSLVEPLRWLFKDEVRRLGEELGLPEEFVWRHPFPGPGLGVRILGEVTPERVSLLQRADAIFMEEIRAAGLYREIAQALVVLLPVRSVGVMGDQRTYENVAALRAVTTEDFMTADWFRLPPDLLDRVARRTVNEVRGINRVVYDVTSKPPGTIEWE